MLSFFILKAINKLEDFKAFFLFWVDDFCCCLVVTSSCILNHVLVNHKICALFSEYIFLIFCIAVQVHFSVLQINKSSRLLGLKIELEQ